MMSKAAGAGMVTALVLASGLATAVPAQATPAPTCVATQTWTSWGWKYARASNYCSTTKRFKFVWAFAYDGSCYSYAVDQQRTDSRGGQSRFDGLQLC